MINAIAYTSPEFTSPDRERFAVLDTDPDRARKFWEAVCETQRIHGMGVRTARLLIGAVEHVSAVRGVPRYSYSGGEMTEFRRLSIRFTTHTQEDALEQTYTASKSLVRQAWDEILSDAHTIHGSPVREAYLQDGGELLRSGLVDHAQAILEFHSEPKEKKRWR